MKYIIKRIIIGVGIALSMFFLKGLILNVQALEVDVKPDSFNLGNNLFTSNSVISGQFTYYGSNTTTYNIYQSYPTLPTFSGTDWLYLPYSTFSNYQFCVETQNTGSVNGVFLNAYSGQSNPFNSNVKVQIQTLDQAQTITDCSLTSSDSARVEFNCNNVDFTKNYRLILANIRSSQYFIRKTLDIQCIAPDSTNSDIINNNNNNTTNIINNNNYNTENIINNQNENTQKQIESQQVCSDVDASNITIDGKFLSSNGTETGASNYGITNFISITKDSKITVTSTQSSTGANYCFYNINKEVISCSTLSTLSLNQELTIPDNSAFFRSSIFKNTGKPTFNICKNGNQAISDGLQDLNHTLNDNTSPDSPVISAFLNDLGLPDDTPISSLILMPITLFQAYQTGLNGQCYRYRIGNLLGTDLELPCIHPELYLGTTLWGIIDVVCCIFLIYRIGLLLVFFFEKITTLSGNLDFMLSTPSGYGSTWGGNS